MGIETYKYEESEKNTSLITQEAKDSVSYKSEVENSREQLSQVKIDIIEQFLENKTQTEQLGEALTTNKEVTLVYNQSFLSVVNEIAKMMREGQKLPPSLEEIGLKAYNSSYPQGATRPSFEQFIKNTADTSNEEKKVVMDFSGRTFRPVS